MTPRGGEPPSTGPGPGGGGAGILSLRPTDAAYPAGLDHLPDPPDPLFARGSLEALARPCVAVVGSRRATAYGRRAAEALARAAAQAGWTVVSGLALGVDGAAHRGSLAGGGPTVAVLGNGVDRAHPRAHARLLDELLEAGGLVLGEHAPGTPARPHHFPRRNRILAALAERVVVVEAAARSGALITAGLAAELGREVWTVPGSIFSPTTAGTHRLLEDGATPVTSLEEWERSLRRTAHPLATGSPQLPLGPTDEGLPRAIWEALEGEPRTLEALAGRLALPSRSLLPVLASLELQGWVERGPGPTYLRRVA